jgi:hypothetical protein
VRVPPVVVVREPPVVVVRGAVVVVGCEPEVVVALEPVVVPVFAPAVVPPDFGGVFAAGLAGAALGAALAGGFLVSVAALARPAAPSSPARIKATEPYLTVLRRECMIIVSSIPFPGPRSIPDARTIYSTLLTLPLVKVTFMSL